MFAHKQSWLQLHVMHSLVHYGSVPLHIIKLCSFGALNEASVHNSFTLPAGWLLTAP